MAEGNKIPGWLGSQHGTIWCQVEWRVMPYQLLTWLGMCFVVAFSSCLDIVAIEMDGGVPLNKNHELVTVGLSNMISGVTGGFTGSYMWVPHHRLPGPCHW
jgi:MFS superfamily sulfate permease-like transporter